MGPDEGRPLVPSPDASGSTFACHRCGACCTDLRERASPAGFAELAPGVYRHERPGGLRVFAWEADVFPDERLAPALVAADDDREARIVLAHELQADTCPHFDPEATRCTVYEDRPLVCRAFPLIVDATAQGPQLAASSVCGARVPLPDEPDRQRLAQAYPEAWAPALAAGRLWAWTVEFLAFLDEAHVVDLRAGLAREELAELEATIGLGDLAAEAGVSTRGELADRARRQLQSLREELGQRQG